MYYAPQNTNEDYGYGSYAYWSPKKPDSDAGYTFDDYFRFYGIGPYIDTCEHNGCDNGEWIMKISGTCSCFEYWELVRGAYSGGVRSANYVLRDLVGENVFGPLGLPESECEDFFRNWVPPTLPLTATP